MTRLMRLSEACAEGILPWGREQARRIAYAGAPWAVRPSKKSPWYVDLVEWHRYVEAARSAPRSADRKGA